MSISRHKIEYLSITLKFAGVRQQMIELKLTRTIRCGESLKIYFKKLKYQLCQEKYVGKNTLKDGKILFFVLGPKKVKA